MNGVEQAVVAVAPVAAWLTVRLRQLHNDAATRRRADHLRAQRTTTPTPKDPS